jgi:MFS transporter, OFA family, oxalate/formate antiporter
LPVKADATAIALPLTEQVVELEAPVPSARNRVRILLGAISLQFAFGLVYSWGAVAPFVEHDLHWQPLLISAVFSATPIGYGTGIIVGGRLADSVPPRRLCWTGLGLLALAGGVALTVPGGLTFVFLYSMLGLGFGGGLGLAGSIAAGRQAMPSQLGLMSGLVTGAYAIAAPIQVPIVSILAGSVGWLPTLRAMAAGTLAIAAIGLAAMPSLPRPRRQDSSSRRLPSPLELVRRPRVYTAILLELTATPLGAYAFVSAAGYARGLQLAAILATAAITAVAIGNALGRVAAGAGSDRAGVDRVMVGVLLLDLAAAAVLYLHPSGPAIVVGGLLAGIGFGAPAGVIGRLADDAAPDAPNSAFGLIFAGFAAGASSGSLLGALVGGSGAWAVLGLPALAGLAVIFLRLRLGKARPTTATT